ncbi:MAG TPA: hypothetical protein VK806_13300 [Bacteroidia bacterium]|jgi:hypothetical protein|nr:hypothetical protein [Bacteroidia bacterium]
MKKLLMLFSLVIFCWCKAQVEPMPAMQPLPAYSPMHVNPCISPINTYTITTLPEHSYQSNGTNYYENIQGNSSDNSIYTYPDAKTGVEDPQRAEFEESYCGQDYLSIQALELAFENDLTGNDCRTWGLLYGARFTAVGDFATANGCEFIFFKAGNKATKYECVADGTWTEKEYRWQPTGVVDRVFNFQIIDPVTNTPLDDGYFALQILLNGYTVSEVAPKNQGTYIWIK